MNGEDITVQNRDKTTTTVVVSSATAYKTMAGSKGTGSTASASALKVGDFIGVQGAKSSDGTVLASSIVISDGPPSGGRGGPVTGGRPPAGAPGA